MRITTNKARACLFNDLAPFYISAILQAKKFLVP